MTMQVMLDRCADVRHDEAGLDELYSRPESRLVRVTAAGLIESFTSACVGDRDPNQHFFLGRAAGHSWFCTSSEGSPMQTALDLRMGGCDPALTEVGQAAIALLAWHRTGAAGPRCEGCGGRSVVIDGGWARQCVDCTATLFPRSDSAMIVALLDSDDRLLLAHRVHGPPERRSLLAGFVEVGETIEAAVVREVAEETQLRVHRLGYWGSQAWPYPRSLMVGWVALAHPATPVVDQHELDLAGWFSRAEVAQGLANGTLSLAPPGSIAGRMIQAWRAGEVTAALATQLVHVSSSG